MQLYARGNRGPDVDPADFGEAILEEFDQDGDGVLAGPELEKAPAVQHRLSDYDGNGDGKVSLDELQTHLAKVFDGRTGLMAAACRVTRNGQPLGGRDVYFVPVPYLEEILPVASARDADRRRRRAVDPRGGLAAKLAAASRLRSAGAVHGRGDASGLSDSRAIQHEDDVEPRDFAGGGGRRGD